MHDLPPSVADEDSASAVGMGSVTGGMLALKQRLQVYEMAVDKLAAQKPGPMFLFRFGVVGMTGFDYKEGRVI